MRKRFGLAAAFAALALAAAPAWSQPGGGGQGGRGGGFNKPQNGGSPLIGPTDPRGARELDPEAYDALSLFGRICVTTRGDRQRAIGIIGDGDPGIEKMDPPLLRGLENGRSGGMGWIVNMPLGDKILIEFPPDGECVVRAPRVDAKQMETAFANLLDQYTASGQFTVHRDGEETKLLDPEPEKGSAQPRKSSSADTPGHGVDKLKFHIVSYTMTFPDTERKAQLVLGTTDSTKVSIQATMTYLLDQSKP